MQQQNKEKKGLFVAPEKPFCCEVKQETFLTHLFFSPFFKSIIQGLIIDCLISRVRSVRSPSHFWTSYPMWKNVFHVATLRGERCNLHLLNNTPVGPSATGCNTHTHTIQAKLTVGKGSPAHQSVIKQHEKKEKAVSSDLLLPSFSAFFNFNKPKKCLQAVRNKTFFFLVLVIKRLLIFVLVSGLWERRSATNPDRQFNNLRISARLQQDEFAVDLITSYYRITKKTLLVWRL